jgi:hypothetical protein
MIAIGTCRRHRRESADTVFLSVAMDYRNSAMGRPVGPGEDGQASGREHGIR